MPRTTRWVLTGFLLAALAGCGKGKSEQASGPAAKTIEDSVYIEIAAQLRCLDRQFASRPADDDEAGKAAYDKARAELLSSFEVSEGDVDNHESELAKDGDTARIQRVTMDISDRIMELEIRQ